MSPPAPAGLWALGLNPDSCWMTASIRAGSTSYLRAAAAMSAEYGAAAAGPFAPAGAGDADALRIWEKLADAGEAPNEAAGGGARAAWSESTWSMRPMAASRLMRRSGCGGGR